MLELETLQYLFACLLRQFVRLLLLEDLLKNRRSLPKAIVMVLKQVRLKVSDLLGESGISSR